jgi:hypothetical protein
MCNPSRSVQCLAALLAASVVLPCGGTVAVAHAAKPAGGIERAMRCAPDGAAGIIHVEVKALVKDVLAGITKGLEPNAIPQAVVQTINKVADKVDAVDVFLLPGGEGPPAPVVAVEGRITPEDINEVLKIIPGLPPDLVLRKKADSIYAMGPDEAPILLLVGGEATGLPAGVMVGGPGAVLTNEFLDGLGKGKNEPLVQLLKDVDTAAPIWLALQMDKLTPASDAPKTIAGGVYPLGGGKSTVAIAFRDANAADKFMATFQRSPGRGVTTAQLVMSVLEPKREGLVVTLSTKTTDSLIPTIVAELSEARRMAKRAASMANIASIGKGIGVYAFRNNDQAPADFLALIKGGEHPGIFISPNSGKPIPKAEKGNVIGPFEPDYVYLKYPDLARADAGLIVAYENPELNKNEGTAVLFVDLHVQWVEMAKFQALLKKSQDAIAAQEKKEK